MDKYPENYEAVSAKYFSKGFSELSGTEQLVFCIWWLEGEVNNGGFHQFFTNSSGDFYFETLDALEKIRAYKTKALLQKASSLAFKGDPPKTQFAREEALATNDDSIFDKLYELDKQFYKYEDDIEYLVNSYLNETRR